MTKWTIRSDEFYGLANGSMCSGAGSVICCLWPADDIAALAFSCIFYQKALAEKQLIGSAFAQAMKDLKTATAQDLLNIFIGSGVCLPENMKRRIDTAIAGAIFGSRFFYGGWRVVGPSEFRL